MGAWGTGLWENDEALDLVGEITASIDKDIRGLTRETASPGSIERLAAAMGLRLGFEPPSFETVTWESHARVEEVDIHGDEREDLAEALDFLREHSQRVPIAAERLLDEIEKGRALSTDAFNSAAHGALDFLAREERLARVDPDLFSTRGGEAYLTELIDSLAARVDNEIEISRDLYDMAGAGGGIGFLVKIPFSRVRPEALDRWESQVGGLRENTSDDSDFWEAYSANVCQALATLRGRCS